MKLVSWNVNGLRALIEKGFIDIFLDIDADIFCLQETKMQEGQASLPLPGYEQYFASAEKKGYSGTAVFTRPKALSVTKGMNIPEHDKEGRVITLEYDKFFLVNVYTPNSQAELARLGYRMLWEDAFREYLLKLDKIKPVIICGDLNVAHAEIDLKNPKTNRKSPGFTDEERNKMTELLASGFKDSFRSLHPDKVEYSWWSYRSNARPKNIGWRIDYFLISSRLLPSVKKAEILTQVMGSDHCPVVLEVEG